MTNHRVVRVNLGARSYDVVIGRGLADEIAPRLRSVVPDSASKAMFVADAGLHEFGRAMLSSLQSAGIHALSAEVEAAENRKSVATAATLLEYFNAQGFGRDAPLIALGGGITGDIAGFVAATYRRGVSWVNCPTTLLAMVDASVGGKTGVNIISDDGTIHKNMVGAFHQPSLVLIDTQWLRTLPPRHVRCGLAECIKHAILCRSVPGFVDDDLFRLTKSLVEAGTDFTQNAEVATELIARNVALKARVVEQDEFESAPDAAGGRALLNLGHTYAHVIEGLPVPTGSEVLHGEAVGLGLVAASHAAKAMGRVSENYVKTVEGLVANAGLPIRLSGLPTTGDLVDRMQADKKSLGGRLRLVLPSEPTPGEFGHVSVVSGPPAGIAGAGWDAIRA